MSFCHCHSVIICGQTLIVDRWRRNVISQTRKLRHRDHEITVRLNDAIKRVQSHACMSFAEHEHLRCWKHQFVKFVLKIAPNRCPKFGSARKMLYLCTRKQEVLGEPSGKPSGEYEWRLRLSIARASSALHSPCTSLVIVNHERQKAGGRPPDAVGRKWI